MSARNPGGVDVKVINPSKGLMTRIPSDQPSERRMSNAWVVARNVRFDDGVIRNAPGYEEIKMLETPATPIVGIFQEQLLSSDRPPFKNPIIITNDSIYFVQRSVYTPPDVLVLDIPSLASVGEPVIVSATNGNIAVESIASLANVPNPTIT